ncbi:MAG: ABC transporter permease [Candidatus Cloacimonetes bacterium]|jgi:phospholipid/cholesterol/gamma-HCH transport system permease protein|nr:ABC transporter permease [Candidatus Cloacimonadota bacterium]MDY0299694.1 ABC transporter permease [Candidatus Cloacimonadaceae bacterium]MCB5279801.1 ABC transporter permease [Candidatus Cloacimonadota bacterium]MCK9332609.1 ABC transporter permease [Candidatus Cloacimonadota bacterium]MDD2211089.1 ABC transporter permease [Candidatus Cloacimonadota bacterium]
MLSEIFAGIGEYSLFVGKSLLSIKSLPRRRLEFLIQFKRIGYDSLFLIMLTAAFTGLVTALQAVYQSKGYIPLNLLSVLIGKSTMVELAPVLTGLVLTGKIGAAMAAEIGSMKVSEQIDALHSMNIKPHEFLYMPRILAGVIAFPLITIFANAISIFCAWYFASIRYGLHYHTFFTNMRAYFEPFDLWSGLVKSVVFGFIITSLACYFGDRSYGGAEGVGRSTTQTVVYSSVAILIMDFIVAWILFGSM